MTIKLSSVRADAARERDGEWIDIPDLPGVRLKVRGWTYGPFQAAKATVEQRWLRKYGKEGAPFDVQLRENGKLYADHLLLEWEGFDTPYSPEIASETLSNPEFRELINHVQYATTRVSTARVEFAEDAEKNSVPPSAGTSR